VILLPRNRRDQGISLIELMTVILIIGILASILLAAASQTRARIQSTHCLVRLSQLGLALNVYVNDEEAYPPIQHFLQNDRVLGWPELLVANAGNSQEILGCPSGGGGAYQYNGYGSGGPGRVPNLGLGGDSLEVPLSPASVKVPSDMIAIADTVFFVLPPRVRPANLRVTTPPQYPHNNGLNVVFCDGHVEHAPKQQLIAPTDQARRRWNNDNQSHPETW
jgi:prepilin-type processing-associated H-X9-DG protein/prepilin-type N-terminal cleavage/methylation domain-containing protein